MVEKVRGGVEGVMAEVAGRVRSQDLLDTLVKAVLSRTLNIKLRFVHCSRRWSVIEPWKIERKRDTERGKEKEWYSISMPTDIFNSFDYFTACAVLGANKRKNIHTWHSKVCCILKCNTCLHIVKLRTFNKILR